VVRGQSMGETRWLGKYLYGVFTSGTRGSDVALRMGPTSLAVPGLIFEVARKRTMMDQKSNFRQLRSEV
jgi:hypothetical protein